MLYLRVVLNGMEQRRLSQQIGCWSWNHEYTDTPQARPRNTQRQLTEHIGTVATVIQK
jgi:hypothetical protein